MKRNMRARVEMQRAFDTANAIVDLDGLLLSQSAKALQQKVIDGEYDFDQAAKIITDKARARRLAAVRGDDGFDIENDLQLRNRL